MRSVVIYEVECNKPWAFEIKCSIVLVWVRELGLPAVKEDVSDLYSWIIVYPAITFVLIAQVIYSWSASWRLCEIHGLTLCLISSCTLHGVFLTKIMTS